MATNLRNGMLQTSYDADYDDIETIKKVKDGVDEEGNTIFIERKTITQVFKPIRCKDFKCPRSVINKDACFIDTWSEGGDVYCDSCGKCLRYERKMEIKRRDIREAKKDNTA